MGEVPLDLSFVVPDLDVDDFNWENTEMDFSTLMDTPLVDNPTEDILPAPDSSVVRHTSQSSTPMIYVPDSAISAAASYFIHLVPTPASRSLVLKSETRPGAHRVVKLILTMLKSYPLMMRDGKLPPYIHPYLASSTFRVNDMEFLNNCMNLMHMISRETQGSRKLFWKNVGMECEHMMAEVDCFQLMVK